MGKSGRVMVSCRCLYLHVCMYVWGTVCVCVSETVIVDIWNFWERGGNGEERKKETRDRQYIISSDDKAYDNLEISLNVEFDFSSSNAIILVTPFAFP